MAASTAAAGPPGPAAARRSLRRPPLGLAADRGYLVVTALAAVGALAGIGYLIWKTVSQTGDIWSTYGVWGFLTGTEWIPNPVDTAPVFGAAPFIYGTLVTSAIAMVVAVPLAIGVALATTVFLPKRGRGPIAALVDLLAAVPSVVYGLWGVLVLVPAAKPALEWIAEHSGPLGFLAGPVTSGSYILAGLVLAVMVLPIVAAITREIFATVPARPAGGGLRARRHALGDGPQRDAAVVAIGHRRRVGARARARRGRDDRHRPAPGQLAERLGLPPRARGDAVERHRARVRRGQQPPALGADRPRRRALRALVHHQRARPAPGGPHGGGPRAAPAGPGRPSRARPAGTGRASDGRGRVLGGRGGAPGGRGRALGRRGGGSGSRPGAAHGLAFAPRPLGVGRGRGLRSPWSSR